MTDARVRSSHRQWFQNGKQAAVKQGREAKALWGSRLLQTVGVRWLSELTAAAHSLRFDSGLENTPDLNLRLFGSYLLAFLLLPCLKMYFTPAFIMVVMVHHVEKSTHWCDMHKFGSGLWLLFFLNIWVQVTFLIILSVLCCFYLLICHS